MIELDIEESKKFIDKGIIVLTNGTKRFYAKTRKSTDPKFMFELVPLTSEELKAIGIEESDQSNDWFVEESATEPTEQEKEMARKMKEAQQRPIDLGNPKDIATAKEILENAEKRLKGSDPEKEQLEEKVDDLEAKMAIIAEKALAEKKKKLGLDPNDPISAEQLMGFERGVKSQGQHAPEGSAPLNDFQRGEKLGKGTYPNIQALIEDLRDREENGDKNASKIIDALFKKSLDHAKSTNTSIPLFTPEEIEIEISKNGFKIPKDVTQGDLYKITHAKGRRELKKRLQQLQQNGQGD